MSIRDYDPADHLPEDTVWVVTAGPAGQPARQVDPYYDRDSAEAGYAAQVAATPQDRVRLWAEDMPAGWAPDTVFDYVWRHYGPAAPSGYGRDGGPREDSHDDDRLAALGLLR